MDIRLKYNGETVTDDIDYSTMVLYDRLGGILDNVLIVLPLSDNSRELSGIEKEDTVSIDTDDFSSGLMYVDDYFRDMKTLTINASSCNPKSKKEKSKIWRNVRLTEIMTDVARNYGLELKMYGITDYIYDSVSQINETDMHMLARICKKERYSIKIDNGCLIVFDEREMEKSESSMLLNENDEDIVSIRFNRSDKCVNSVTVSYYDFSKGLITYKATDENVIGSSKKINEYLKGFDEAKRFAYGYLRDLNKYQKIANATLKYNPKISAGTVIECEGFGEFEGRYIAYEVSHDVVLNVTKLKIRSVLENY